MHRIISWACAICLSGCAASPAQRAFYVDASTGAHVADQGKFQDAKTICIAESDKISPPEVSNNPFTQYDQQLSYLNRKDDVVRGCMLEKGYRLTTK